MKRIIFGVALALALLTPFLAKSRVIAIDPPVAKAQTIPPVIQELIKCESSGVNVAHLDSNGKMSYGILQFQMATWNEWEQKSGIIGSPMNEETAITMAEWAIAHGYLGHWTCAHLLGLVH